MSIFVRILSILVAIGFVVLAYYVVIWVLAIFGVSIPSHILAIIFTILGLLVAIGVLTGRFDNINWFGPAGP